MKAREKTPYLQYVEAMGQSDCKNLFGKTPDEEKRFAYIYETRRNWIQQLVEYLQHLKDWEPARRAFTSEEANSEASENKKGQGSDRGSINESSISLADDKRMVTFSNLHEYSSKVIGEWNGHLMCVLGAAGGALLAGATTGLGVLAFLSHLPISGLLATLFGVIGFFTSLVGLIPEAIELAKSAPKAMPALATRGHLKRFFNTYPKQVEACTASERVLNQIRLPARE